MVYFKKLKKLIRRYVAKARAEERKFYIAEIDKLRLEYSKWRDEMSIKWMDEKSDALHTQRTKYKSHIDEINKKHKDEKSFLIKKHKEEVIQFKKSFDIIFKETKDFFKLEMHNLKQDHKNEIKNIIAIGKDDKKQAIKSAMESRDKKIYSLEKQIAKIKKKLIDADEMMKKSRKAYEKFRESHQSNLDLATDLKEQINNIFLTSGNLSQKFNAIKDRLEFIDRNNQRNENEILGLLDMQREDMLVNIEQLK